METPTAPGAREVTTPRYDAFISYRHVEPDRKCAIWLHTALETYRVPNTLVQKGVAPRLQRCFRDEEELPASADLNNQIEQALEQSRFLIVICSPRTPQSLWVNKEVERFRELGRNDRILALLIEGEPSDSFPRALREIRRTVVDSQGMAREEIEEVEPLAADVRARPNESERHLARMAQLRLMACILGVRFDDLRQREAERRARRLAYLSIAAGILMLVMAGLAIIALLQRAEAVRQSSLAQENEQQAIRARKEAQHRLAESLVSQGDVYASSSRWTEAARAIQDAFGAFADAGEQPFPAELALWQLQLSSPAPLNPFAAPRTLGRGAVALSPDARFAAALKEDQSLALWDLRTGRSVWDLPVIGGFAQQAAISRDNKRLISAHTDGTIRVWDLATGKLMRTLTGHKGPVLCVAFAPDPRFCVSGGADATLRIWSVDANQLVATLEAHTAAILSIAVAPDGTIVSGGADGTVRLWHYSRREKRLLGDTHAPVTGVAISPDAKSAVSVEGAETVLWNIATSERERTFAQPQSAAGGAAFVEQNLLINTAFSADGDRILRVGGNTAVAQVVRGLAVNRIFAGHERAVEFVAFSSDGDLVLTGGRDKRLLQWRVGSDRESRAFEHGTNVYSVDLSRSGSIAITGGGIGKVKLWDAFTGRELSSFSMNIGRVICVALAPDGRTALVGGDDHSAHLLDLLSGKQVLALAGHTSEINGVAFAPDGSRALTASKDGTVKLWRLSDGKEERTFTAHSDKVVAVAFAQDHNRFVSCGVDGKVILWNIDSTTPVHVFAGHEKVVRSVKFSPNGRQILSGSDDGTMRLWDVYSGKLIRTISADPVAVCSVAFSPDGRMLFSAGANKSLRVWDAASGREWRNIKGFEESVWSVALSGDGMLCLAGSNDGTALLSDFASISRQREMEPRLKSAIQKLAENRDDPASLKVLGEWYALRGVWPWAIEFLERARRGGADVSPLMLGRCRWLNGDAPGAIAEFQKSLAAKEADETYLKLCLQKLSTGGTN